MEQLSPAMPSPAKRPARRERTDAPSAGALCHTRVVHGVGDERGQAAYLAFLDDAMETRFLDPFAMDLALYALGPLIAVRLTATRRRTRRLAERIPEEAPDAIHVQLALAGEAHGEAGGRPVASRPGTVMLLDNRQPFAIIDAGPRTVLDITVPRHMIDVGGDPARLHGVVLADGPAGMLVDTMTALAEAIDTLPAAAGPAVATALLALLAVAIGDDTTFAPPEDRVDRIVARARRWVDYKLASPDLGPEWMARKLGVSRSELYAVLQPFGGVRRFITEHRLLAAERALGDERDRRRIADIAFGVGFQSEAHFSRAFKLRFGQSPSAARAAAAASR